jgi:hypothetical protein
MRWPVLLLGVTLASACESATLPLAFVNADLTGSWLDSTDFQQLNFLAISQFGDSLRVTSPHYYLRSAWNGAAWWQPEGTPDSATGKVTLDSVALCDRGLTTPCPNEIAYLRDSAIVLYYTEDLHGSPYDSAGLGVRYVHQPFTAVDTIAPLNAPPPLLFSGVWFSDSVATSSSSCTTASQIALAMDGPTNVTIATGLLQLTTPTYKVQESARNCGSSVYRPDSVYVASVFPYPCTPADNCVAVLIDVSEVAIDLWFLNVASTDSLIDNKTYTFQVGYTPSYFLRDAGAASVMSGRPDGSRPLPLVKSRAAAVRIQKRFRQLLRRAPLDNLVDGVE